MKKLLSAIGVILGILVIGLMVLTFTIDGMVKSNIEGVGSEILSTPVEVDDVGISIFDGSGTIEGITIHNPDDFSDNPAVQLQQISMQVDLYTLISDTVVINNIHIQKPEIFFEQKISGSNLNVLQRNLGSSSSTDIKLIVDYLLVEDGLITLTADIGAEKSTAKAEFERFELTDIGREGSNTMDQTMRQILQPILKRAAQEVVRQGLLDLAKDKLKVFFEG